MAFLKFHGDILHPQMNQYITCTNIQRQFEIALHNPKRTEWYIMLTYIVILQIADLLQRRSLFEKETKVFLLANFKVFLKFSCESRDDSRFLVKKPRNSREENLRLLFEKRRSFISVAKEQQFVVL